MIEYTNLQKNYALYAKEYEEATIQVFREVSYILGKKTEQFEKSFASYLGVNVNMKMFYIIYGYYYQAL